MSRALSSMPSLPWLGSFQNVQIPPIFVLKQWSWSSFVLFWFHSINHLAASVRHETNDEPPVGDLTDILVRLSVKDLFRYRSVSKPWCSLIDSPDFVKNHLKHSSDTYSNTGLIIRGCDLNWVDLHNLNSSEKLIHPLDLDGGMGADVLGSCNGLLALINIDDDIALWNPFTKRYKILPILLRLNFRPAALLFVNISFTDLGMTLLTMITS